MTSWRSDLRADVRAAISGSARFGEFTTLNIWAKSVNAADLPAIGTGIPRETADRETLDSTTRSPLLAVVVKRMGADLEDLADADSAEIERLVMGVYDGTDVQPDLTETTYSEDPGGQRPVSTLTLMFVVPHWITDPLT
ncbi:hypothetical protein KUV73_04065 [Mameliella alba]|nr:hypothetical protein [Mameliella alba]MBY6168502.1 hypothetical protein [Mameliella alba]MBY6173521.1 hypothetical protein [Mameliella alba]